MNNYHIKTSPIDNGPNYIKSTLVEIYLDEAKIGEYIRNYGSFAQKTFHPFEQSGKEYALYSKNYTTTRVMSLPDCIDICGEEPDSFGFCPVEYYIPAYQAGWEDLDDFDDDTPDTIYGSNGKFGFVAGCAWGDDTSWKIQFLDLSRIGEAILVRDDRFGYLEMPRDSTSLKDCVKVCFNNKWIEIIHAQKFEINKLYTINEKSIDSPNNDSARPSE